MILFGSRARGDARPDSDYDLVVELPFERTDYYLTYGRVSAALRHAKNGAATDILIRAPGEIEQKRDGAIDGMLDSPRPTSWTAVACHAQQLAEKHLKVRFIFQHTRPPQTHRLSELIQRLGAFGYPLLHLLGDAELLEPYAAEVRYPGDLAIPDEPTGRAAVAAAQRTVGAVRTALSE